MYSLLARFVMLVLFVGAVANAQSQAPPVIDMTELQNEAHGNGMIWGTVHSPFAGASAFCVPAIPYVEWYFGSWGHPGTSTRYDSRLIPYTRRVPLNTHGTFLFTDLAAGEYVVWISGDGILEILTYGPPIGGTVAQRQSADLATKYVKHVVVGYGTAFVAF